MGGRGRSATDQPSVSRPWPSVAQVPPVPPVAVWPWPTPTGYGINSPPASTMLWPVTDAAASLHSQPIVSPTSAG